MTGASPSYLARAYLRDPVCFTVAGPKIGIGETSRVVGGAAGLDPAADAALVLAVGVTESLGQVTLLAVNDLAAYHQEDPGQDH